jgi:hypothetical protein
MQVSEQKEPVTLCVTNWDETQTVDLDDVDPRATISEVVSEALQAMSVPPGTMFSALWGERELSLADSVAEVGLRSGDALRLVPEVRAGAVRGAA